MSPIATPTSSIHTHSPGASPPPNGGDYPSQHLTSTHDIATSSGSTLCNGLGMVDVMELMRTIDFAAKKHRNQRRKDCDETPYINHPIAVASILSAHGISHLPTLQAALLHDTVEDTDTTIEELRDVFGDEVAGIVLECTDPPTLSSLARKALQTKTAPNKSPQAQRVKLADKLHNLNSIRESPPVGWTVERCQKYFAWAKTVTDPCLHSLPSLGPPLSNLYYNSHFVLNNKTYKCHPTLGSDEVPEEEEAFLKEARKRQRLWSKSPRSSIFF